MDSLISTFHLDLKLLIAQIINFAIVFAVLYYFALKPLFKTMAERTGKIEKSLDDAKKIEARLGQAEDEYREIVVKARQEAAAVMEKTGKEALERRDEMIARTKEEIGQIINSEREKIRAEKASTLKEIKAEVADLVAASLEKILDKKLTGKDDSELIKKIVMNAKK